MNVCEITDIPTWLLHSDSDPIVTWEAPQVMVDALEECGSDVRFTLLEGMGAMGHETPGPVDYSDEALFNWMMEQVRGE